ncbi:MAG: hypothetical protein ACXW03_12220, partial [Methylobacter sp.]
YSTDLSNLRMKKSFGTALKLFSYNNMTATALMTICTLMLYSIAPSPTPLIKVWKKTQWNNYLAQVSFEVSDNRLDKQREQRDIRRLMKL